MNDYSKSAKKLNPNFKSAKLLNRPSKNKNSSQEDVELRQNLDSNVNKRQNIQNKNVSKPKSKQNDANSQNTNVKATPSEIAVFNANQISSSSISMNSIIPETLLAEAVKNNRIKLPGYLDIPSKLSENIDRGVPGLTPGVSSDAGRIHDNLDRLKDEFCRFIDFKYHASTIGNTDLEQRFFLRNCFEKLKDIDYPTIKMEKWNEYQNMLLEQKKNLLLFQKSRGGDQPLDDAWCQTDEHFFEEFVNDSIKIKFEKLKEIKMKRSALKKKLCLKGYFDVTDFDDIEQIFDFKMLETLGLNNQFLSDSSEDEFDNLMDCVSELDPTGRIEYNNYQIRQILSVFDNKLKRKCRPDYYEFFFGHLDYEREKLKKSDLSESKTISKELKLKLVEFLDKKLHWSEIETPWEWEHDFAINEVNCTKNSNNFKQNDLDSSILRKIIPKDFLKELTDIRKEYRKEWLDNQLKIFEKQGLSNDIRNKFSIEKEFVKNELYGNKIFNEKIKSNEYEKNEFSNINFNKAKKSVFLKENKINFKQLETSHLKTQNSNSMKIIKGINETYSNQNSNDDLSDYSISSSKAEDFNTPKKNKYIQEEIMVNLSKLILSKEIDQELRNDLIKHFNKMFGNRQKELSNFKQEKKKLLSSDNILGFDNNEHSFKEPAPNSSDDPGFSFKVNNSINTIKTKLKISKLTQKETLSPVSVKQDFYNKLRQAPNLNIEDIEAQLGVLRNAAGILDILKELEQELTIKNNREKFKSLIFERTSDKDLNLENNEIKQIEEEIEGMINDFLEKRNNMQRSKVDSKDQKSEQ